MGEMLAACPSQGDATALDWELGDRDLCVLGHPLRERGASLVLNRWEGRSGYG